MDSRRSRFPHLPDRTYLAVRRQLEGMRCAKYELGIRNNASGQMIIQHYTHEQVLKSVGFLKSKNATGADIYIRPAGSQGLILVDDLTREAVNRLKKDQVTPACVIETSPDNFQVWVRVSETLIPPALATNIARHLAVTYNADPNSADFRHFGRLAGFTNRKPLYVALYGKTPYVLAHECKGLQAKAGASLLRQQAPFPHPQVSPASMRKDTTSPNPEDFYQTQMAFYADWYGALLDISRADWAIVGKMLAHGFEESIIVDTLLRCSPALQERKKGHVEDYIERTIRKRVLQKA